MKTSRFDVSEYLGDEESIAEYLAVALDNPDPDVYLAALSHVAKARGITRLARETGLGRESLYKALAPGAKPRFETVMKISRALGAPLGVKS